MGPPPPDSFGTIHPGPRSCLCGLRCRARCRGQRKMGTEKGKTVCALDSVCSSRWPSGCLGPGFPPSAHRAQCRSKQPRVTKPPAWTHGASCPVRAMLRWALCPCTGSGWDQGALGWGAMGSACRAPWGAASSLQPPQGERHVLTSKVVSRET